MSQEKTEIQGIVEIGQKPVVARNATARGRLNLQPKTKAAIIGGAISKGNVLEASTIAAIQAVKETPRIIPHCHPIPLEVPKLHGHGKIMIYGVKFMYLLITKPVLKWKR